MPISHISRKDKIVQSTDIDALSSRYSAVCKGYLDDPYIETMVRSIKTGIARSITPTTFIPKLPLINRGSYVRNYSIDRLVSQFLNTESKKQQIISLGAGSDTRPFKLLKEHANLVYHELDFGVSTAHKARVIHENADMKRIVDLENGDCDFEKGEIHTRNYHLHPIDLRMIKCNGEFTLPGIKRDSESLIVSECCLCYLEPHESENVLKWIVQSFSNVGLVLYEPVGGTDNFGVVMMQNLASRGISLPTLHKYPTLQSQVIRLKDLGFTNASASDMEYIHDHWLQPEEKHRLDKLEFLDEREEMNLLLRHYCLVWAGNGTCWTGWHSSSHNS